MAAVLFEDIFDIKNIDPEGKKFDRGKFLKSYIDINNQIIVCHIACDWFPSKHCCGHLPD